MRLLRKINGLFYIIAGAFFLASALTIGVDIVLRQLFNTSIGGADELSGYALAIGTAWGLGPALVDRAHIRIDLLYGRIPQAARRVADLIGVLAFGAFVSVICYSGFKVAFKSLSINAHSQSALKIAIGVPQFIWACGLAVFVITCVVVVITAVRRLINKDNSGAASIIGIKGVDEEVQDEIDEALGRLSAYANNKETTVKSSK